MTLVTAHDASQHGDGAAPVVDTNILVAANLRAVRRHRGLTQSQVADRLAELMGRRLPDASISQMESGGYPSGRRRRFDAHDLVLLGQVFDVPVVYFLLPQVDANDTHERLRGLLGARGNLDVVDQRLTAPGLLENRRRCRHPRRAGRCHRLQAPSQHGALPPVEETTPRSHRTRHARPDR